LQLIFQKLTAKKLHYFLYAKETFYQALKKERRFHAELFQTVVKTQVWLSEIALYKVKLTLKSNSVMEMIKKKSLKMMMMKLKKLTNFQLVLVNKVQEVENALKRRLRNYA